MVEMDKSEFVRVGCYSHPDPCLKMCLKRDAVCLENEEHVGLAGLLWDVCSWCIEGSFREGFRFPPQVGPVNPVARSQPALAGVFPVQFFSPHTHIHLFSAFLEINRKRGRNGLRADAAVCSLCPLSLC